MDKPFRPCRTGNCLNALIALAKDALRLGPQPCALALGGCEPCGTCDVCKFNGSLAEAEAELNRQ